MCVCVCVFANGGCGGGEWSLTHEEIPYKKSIAVNFCPKIFAATLADDKFSYKILTQPTFTVNLKSFMLKNLHSKYLYRLNLIDFTINYGKMYVYKYFTFKIFRFV